MKTVQRLQDADSLLVKNINTGRTNSISEIQSQNQLSVSNGTVSITGENYCYKSHYVAQIIPNNSTSDVVITLPINSLFNEFDLDETFVFTCLAYCDERLTISAKIYDVNSAETVYGNSRRANGGYWSPVRSNRYTIPENADLETTEIVVELTVSGHQGNLIRLSTLNLVNDDMWAVSPVLKSITQFMPDFYVYYDGLEEDPQYPMHRLIEFMSDGIADTMYLYSDWVEYENRELINGLSNTIDISAMSRLVNYRAVRNEFLPWVSQFSGHTIVNSIYDANGNQVQISDQQLFTQLQLNPAIYGLGSGTSGSIENAVKLVLSGDKTVVISQRYQGDPWKILIITEGSETTDVDYRGKLRVASTANINISTGLASGSTVDGITLVTGDLVLLKNQTTASQNGVYVVPASGAASRYSSFDETSEIVEGAVFYVSEGDTNGDKSYEMTTTGSVIVGMSNIVFSEYGGSPAVLAMAEEAKPLGYKIYHSIVEDFTLTLGSTSFGVLGTAVL